MAVKLKAPGSRRRTGALMTGMGEGIDQFLQYYMRNNAIEKQDKLVTERQAKLKDIEYKRADEQQAKLDLEKVPAYIGSVGPDTTDMQILQGLKKAGADTNPSYGVTGQDPGGEENLPSTQFGPKSSQSLTDAFGARSQAIGQEGVAASRKATEAGQMKESEGLGTGRAAHINAPTVQADELALKTALGPVEATNAGLSETAKKTADLDPAIVKGEAGAAGARAKAVSDAEYPNQAKLATTRADTTLLNAKALDDYKREHPHATAAQIDRVAGAHHALEMSKNIRTMLGEMDKRGMLGSIGGRISDLAAGKIKESDLFKNPEDAKLASDFFAEFGYLQKKAAQVHSGIRGASSPGMISKFEAILNGIGDRNMTEGQLDAVDRVMSIYAKDPNAPDEINMPGLDIPAPVVGPPNSRTELPSSLQRVLNR